MGRFSYTLFVIQKYKPAKQAFWCTRNSHGFVWNSGSLKYNELQNILDLEAGYYAKGTKSARFCAI